MGGNVAVQLKLWCLINMCRIVFYFLWGNFVVSRTHYNDIYYNRWHNVIRVHNRRQILWYSGNFYGLLNVIRFYFETRKLFVVVLIKTWCQHISGIYLSSFDAILFEYKGIFYYKTTIQFKSDFWHKGTFKNIES